MSVGDN